MTTGNTNTKLRENPNNYFDSEQRNVWFDETPERTLNERVCKGVETFCNPIKITLGSKGRTVIFNHLGGTNITKDGVSIANLIQARDPYEEMVIKVLRQACRNTVNTAGDGTTSTAILAQAIFESFNELINIEKSITYYEFEKVTKVALQDILNRLKKYTKKANTKSILRKIVNISANNKEIGDLFNLIFTEVGIDCAITAQKNYTLNHIEPDVTDGLKLDFGYYHKVFANDLASHTFTGNDCNIVIVNGIITNTKYVIDLVNECIVTNKNLLIICDDISKYTFQEIKANLDSTNYAGLCIAKHGAIADYKTALLKTISLNCGAKVIEESLFNTRGCSPSSFGICSKILVTENYTTIIGGNSDSSGIAYYKEELEAKIKHINTNPYMKGKLTKLKSIIDNGTVIINVGAQTEVEMSELYDRIDDAICAVKAAKESGYCYGGGYTWLRIVDDLWIDSIEKNTMSYTKKEIMIYNRFLNCLLTITKTLCDNSSFSFGEYINQYKVNKNLILDISTNQIKDVKDTTILDASKSLTESLLNAYSVSKSLLNLKAGLFDGYVLM